MAKKKESPFEEIECPYCTETFTTVAGRMPPHYFRHLAEDHPAEYRESGECISQP